MVESFETLGHGLEQCFIVLTMRLIRIGVVREEAEEQMPSLLARYRISNFSTSARIVSASPISTGTTTNVRNASGMPKSQNPSLEGLGAE